MKATYGEITNICKCIKEACNGSCIESREIFKDPITDDGTKKSKKGLLQVAYNSNGKLEVFDQCTWGEEKGGLLTTVFKDGKLVKETALEEIRGRLKLS